MFVNVAKKKLYAGANFEHMKQKVCDCGSELILADKEGA
jgi:hypothetical protein